MKLVASLPSSCAVSARKSDQLDALIVTLKGGAAWIPSISNHRMIGYRWGRDKSTGGRKKFPFIKKTASQINAMERLHGLFRLACYDAGLGAPTFGGEPVHVLALLAERKGVWDSHNSAKALGDWLQESGVVANDSQAEIDVRKKSEYSPFVEDLQTTEIIITRRDLVFSLNVGFIHAVKNAVR